MTNRSKSMTYILAGIVLIAVTALAIWIGPNTPHQSAAAMAYGDAFRNANLDNLPVQEIEDQTLVYPRAAQR